MTTIYVGNLPFSATEAEVRNLFEKHGAVQSVKLVNDRETGRPRGFGFVEMSTNEGAEEAISRFNGRDYEGRRLQVEKAKSPAGGGGGGRPARSGGGGGGFGRGGGGGNRW